MNFRPPKVSIVGLPAVSEIKCVAFDRWDTWRLRDTKGRDG